MKNLFAFLLVLTAGLSQGASAATTITLKDLTHTDLNSLEGLLGALVRNGSDLAICNKVGQFNEEVRTTMRLTSKNMDAQLAKAKTTLGEKVVPPKSVDDRDMLVNALFELSLSADAPCLNAKNGEPLKRSEIKAALIKMYRGYIALIRLRNPTDVPSILSGLDIFEGGVLSSEEKALIRRPVTNTSELIRTHEYKLGVNSTNPDGSPEVDKTLGHKI